MDEQVTIPLGDTLVVTPKVKYHDLGPLEGYCGVILDCSLCVAGQGSDSSVSCLLMSGAVQGDEEDGDEKDADTPR